MLFPTYAFTSERVDPIEEETGWGRDKKMRFIVLCLFLFSVYLTTRAPLFFYKCLIYNMYFTVRTDKNIPANVIRGAYSVNCTTLILFPLQKKAG